MPINLDLVSPEDIVDCCNDEHIINVIKNNIKLLKLAHRLATIVTDDLEVVSVWKDAITTTRSLTTDHDEMMFLAKELLSELEVKNV